MISLQQLLQVMNFGVFLLLCTLNDCLCTYFSDVLGKKIFIGTLDGHVMLFDSISFGLLQHLSKPDLSFGQKKGQTGSGHHGHGNSQGFVASLVYVERDELLITLYAWGAIKIFSGCHRSSNTLNETPIMYHPPSGSNYPGACGGQPPCHKLMFRECDFGFEASQESTVVAAVMSELHNVIIVAIRNGHIRIFDYLTLQLQAVLQSPMIAGQVIENTCLAVLGNLPVILVGDNVGHVHVFSFAPLPLQWIVSFCPWTIYADKGAEPVALRDENDIEGNTVSASTGGAVRVLSLVYYEHMKHNLMAESTPASPGSHVHGTAKAASGKSTPSAAGASSKGKIVFSKEKDKNAIPPKLNAQPFRFKTFRDELPPVQSLNQSSVVSSSAKSVSGAGGGAGHGNSSSKDGRAGSISARIPGVAIAPLVIPAGDLNATKGLSSRRDMPVSAASAATTGTAGTTSSSQHANRRARHHSNARQSLSEFNKQNAQSSSVLEDGLDRTWVLLMGDDVGRFYQMDLTKLLIKAGCCEVLTTNVVAMEHNAHAATSGKADIPSHDHTDSHLTTSNLSTTCTSVLGSLAYAEAKANKMFVGMTRAASVALEYQLKRPVGSHVTEYTRTVNGVNNKDVILIKKWTAFGGVAIRAICPVMDTRRRYAVSRHGKSMTPSQPPKSVILASDVGIIKSWSWEGELQGEMADEPSDEVPDIPKNLVKGFKKQQQQQDNDASPIKKLGGTGGSPRSLSPQPNPADTNATTSVGGDSIKVIVNASAFEDPSVHTQPGGPSNSKGQNNKAAAADGTDDSDAQSKSSTNSAEQLLQELLKAIEADVDIEAEAVLQPVRSGYGWNMDDQGQKQVQPQKPTKENDKNSKNNKNNKSNNSHGSPRHQSIATTVMDPSIINTRAISACRIVTDYIGALTAWVMPQIRITEVEMNVTKTAGAGNKYGMSDTNELSTFATTISDSHVLSTSSPSPYSSQQNLFGALQQTGGSSPTQQQQQLPPAVITHTEFKEIGHSTFDEKYFSNQFFDIHFSNKAREFADSITHVPLDYLDAESLDPHEFQSSVLHIEKFIDSFQAFLAETESVRKRGEEHIQMVNEFKNIWCSKVRFKCLEYELDNGIFNTFPDPDFALGKTKYGSLFMANHRNNRTGNTGRSSGVDFLVERAMRALENADPAGFQELQAEIQLMKRAVASGKVYHVYANSGKTSKQQLAAATQAADLKKKPLLSRKTSALKQINKGPAASNKAKKLVAFKKAEPSSTPPIDPILVEKYAMNIVDEDEDNCDDEDNLANAAVKENELLTTIIHHAPTAEQIRELMDDLVVVRADGNDDSAEEELEINVPFPAQSKLVVQTDDLHPPLIRRDSSRSTKSNNANTNSLPKLIRSNSLQSNNGIVTPTNNMAANTSGNNSNLNSLSKHVMLEKMDRSTKMDRILFAFEEPANEEANDNNAANEGADNADDVGAANHHLMGKSTKTVMSRNVQFNVPDSPAQPHQRPQSAPAASNKSSRSISSSNNNNYMLASSKSAFTSASGYTTNTSNTSHSGSTDVHDRLFDAIVDDEELERRRVKQEFYGKLSATANRFDTLVSSEPHMTSTI
jgi:hypothetical protein